MHSTDHDSDNTPFIVEMAWGRPTQAKVYAYGEDGGLVGMTVIRSREPSGPNRRRVYCTRELWYAVLALGRKSGWLPMGTVPAPRCNEEWQRRGRFDNGYDPDIWLYAKQLEAADTAELADALERALGDSGAGETMQFISALPRVAPRVRDGGCERVHERLSHAFLREFIAFLRKGPLELAWADWPKGAANQ